MKSNDLKNDYLLIISRALISLILFFGASVAGALNEGSQTYTLDGILYQKGTTTPLLDSAALLKIQIISPDGNCLLYEESQTVDTSTTKGYFNIQVGSALANTKRTVNDPGLTMAQIFQNTLAVSATSVPSRTCSGNSYTPSAGQSRYFRITVTPSLTTVADVLTPDIVLDSVPQAIVAQSIQGLERADLLHRSTAVGVSLDQTNLEALFTGSSYTNLQSILSGNFMRVGTSGATLPSYASTPSGVSAGQMWYDSTTNQVKYQSNSGVQTIGTSSGGISSLTVAAALSVNGTVAGTVSSGTVTLDLANTGVSTGTYALVTVDTKGRVTAGAVSLTEAELPVISTVGKVSGNAITSGTISGSTSMVTTGNLLTSGVVSGTTVNATTVVAGTISGSTVQGTTLSGSTVQASNLRIYNGIQYVQFTAQAMSSSYSMALPTADGISGQVMATNGSGILSWITPSSGIAGTISIGQGGTAATSFSASRIIASNSTGTAMVSFGCALNEVISFDVSGMAQCSSIGSIAGSGLIANGGNTTGAAVSIGTNDNYALQLKASNAVAMTISTNGNVGIGTESPSAKFDINNSAVNTTSAILARGVNDSNFQFLVKSGSSGSAAGTVQGVIGLDYPAGSNYDIAAIKFLRGGGAADGSLAFYTYNNERVRIDASGNLGIGTTSPATALDVSGVLTARGLSSAPSVAASNTGRIYYDYSTNKFKVSQNSEAYVDLIPAGGAGDLLNGGNTTGLAVTVGTNDAQPLNLEVNNTTAMTISQSGNVGIGTTAPGTILDIAGAQSFREMAAPAVSPADQGRIYFDSTANKFKVSENGGAYVDLIAASSGGDLVGPASATDNAIARFDGTTGKLVQNSGVVIDDFGNVGIGTATPSYALDVQNSANFVANNSSVTFGMGLTRNYSTSSAESNAYGQLINYTKSGATAGVSDRTYGQRVNVTRTGASNTTNPHVYGVYSSVAQSGAASGNPNAYGMYTSVTGATDASSTAWGHYITASGADLNYGLYSSVSADAGSTAYGVYVDAGVGAGTEYAGVFMNGNVGFGTTGPTSILHTVASGAKTAAYTGNYLSNTATSSTASINKIGLDVQSTGSWTGASAVNTGLNVTVSGGTTNYSATFQGGNVGIGTTAPTELLDVNGGIRLGTTSGSNAGTIRWDGTNFSGYNGSAWVNFVPDPPASGACDTVSTYSTAGTYAYTVPASFGTITVRLWGAGGGGGGSHSSGAGTTGATGGNSTISSLGLFASGGSGGAPGSNTPVLGTGGAGGAAAGGATNTTGNAGSAATSSGSGAGGTAPNGGAGGASQGSATTSGLAGSSPGGGGSGARSSSTIAGGGAGSGGYVEKTFTSATLNPGTAISDIVVGASGAGGSGANSGGAGGTGRVSITCASAGAPVTNDRGVLFMNGGTYSTATNFVYDSSGRVGVGTSTPTVSLDMGSNTDGIRMPSGTTAQQITCNSGAAGTMRYNTQTTFMEYCDGSSWNALPKIQPASPPTTPSGGGYFVVTQSTYTGNLGGLAGANAACLTELTTYTNWAGYADANSRGLLNSSKVKAYLCDNSSCNQGVPLATYAYGAVGFPGVGGGTMTVDSSGYGPNDSTSWAAANRFGSAYLIWTGRYSTSATAWSGAAAGFNCSSWSTAGAGSNGEIGYASNTDKTRWYGGISTCDIPRNLVCFVNP